jgi:hypothetical protein
MPNPPSTGQAKEGKSIRMPVLISAKPSSAHGRNGRQAAKTRDDENTKPKRLLADAMLDLVKNVWSAAFAHGVAHLMGHPGSANAGM